MMGEMWCCLWCGDVGIFFERGLLFWWSGGSCCLGKVTDPRKEVVVVEMVVGMV